MNYYIQGNAAKAEKIKAAFKNLGYDCKEFDFSCGFFFTHGREIHFCISGYCINYIIKTHPDYKELPLLVQPKFKAGDKIEATIYGINRKVTIREVDETNRCYFGTLEECIGFTEQDQWHLVPKPNYDISNFHAGMPVLVRDSDEHKWLYTIFGIYDKHNSVYPFVVVDMRGYEQCIPFKGNEHLLGTTDMCDEMYINW